MNPCRLARTWIPDHAADLDRPPPAVRRHLARCLTCRREAASDRRWIRELTALRTAAPAVDARERVLAALEGVGQPRRSQGAAAAALAAAVLLTAGAAGMASVFGADTSGLAALAGAATDVIRAAMRSLAALGEAASVALQPAVSWLLEGVRALTGAEAAARASLAAFIALLSALAMLALLRPKGPVRRSGRPV